MKILAVEIKEKLCKITIMAPISSKTATLFLDETATLFLLQSEGTFWVQLARIIFFDTDVFYVFTSI